ncbi:AraC family transcriptional regulator [Erysipelothrix urinaevulpis]
MIYLVQIGVIILAKIIYELHTFDNPHIPIIFHNDRLVRGYSHILPHWHANLELLLVIEGTIEVNLDQTIYTVNQGSVVVINSNEIHAIKPITNEVEYYCLILDYSFCRSFDFDTQLNTFKSINQDPELIRLMELVAYEIKELKNHYELAIKALCNTILITLFRNQLVADTPIENSQSKLDLVQNAMTYIHFNYQQPLTLEDVSESIGVSKFYLSRLFTELTQTNFSNYVLKFRCFQAYNLLIKQKMNVSETSNYCGFNSVPYFSKSFKNQFGITPSEALSISWKKEAKSIRTFGEAINHEINGVYFSADLDK